MDAWGKWTNVSDKVIMAADGNGDFVKATGLVQGIKKNMLPPSLRVYSIILVQPITGGKRKK